MDYFGADAAIQDYCDDVVAEARKRMTPEQRASLDKQIAEQGPLKLRHHYCARYEDVSEADFIKRLEEIKAKYGEANDEPA